MLLSSASIAHGGLLNGLGKSGKAASRVAPAAARLSKTEVLAASAGLGAGVIYVDVHGSKLFMELAESRRRQFHEMRTPQSATLQ